MKLLAQAKINLLVNGERTIIHKGKTFNLQDEKEAQRLITLKAAIEVEEAIETDEKAGEDNSGAENLDGEVTAETLAKLTKAKICEYAASIGLELSESMQKEDLINKVIDHIEENQQFGGDDGQ